MEVKHEERGWYVEQDGRIATIENRSFFESEAEAQDAAGRLVAITEGTAPTARDGFAVGDSVTATIDVDADDAAKVVVDGLEKKR